MIIVMKKWMKHRGSVVFFFVVWLLLVMSFVGNFFGTGLWDGWFDGFQKDSSAIIEKTVYCKKTTNYKGPLIVAVNSDYNKVMTGQDCDMAKMKPYAPQYGAQARIITEFASSDASRVPTYLKKVSMLLALLTALIMAAIAQKTRKLFGLIPASVFVAMVVISPWIVGYARNIYWIEPLMIAPFAIAFVGYQYFKNSKRLWLFYAIELLVIFLKLLNGYEYVSTIAISVLVPIVFFELVDKKTKIINLWKQAAIVLTVTIIAFVGAYWMNFSALASYYGSSERAVEVINARASERGIAGIRSMRLHAINNLKTLRPETYNFINQITNLDDLANNNGRTYKYILLNALNYLLLPAIILPVHIGGMFGEVIQSVTFWIAIGYLIIFNTRKCIQKKYHRSLLWSMHLSVAGALSWLILMPGHALPHAHINGVVFCMPLLLFVYMLVGLWIGYIVKQKDTSNE